MDTVQLSVTTRNSDEKVRHLRMNRFIPAIFYGNGEKNVSLKVFEGDFVRLYRSAGESTIIDLDIDEGALKKKVLVHHISRDPVSDRISHIDFINVNMDKEITAHVPLVFVGTAPAVKDLGGIVNTQKSELTVRCLPKHLIHEIEVDISSLVDFHSLLHVEDIKVPENIKIMEGADEVVIMVSAPKEEKEEEPVVAAVEGEEAAKAEGEDKSQEAGKESSE